MEKGSRHIVGKEPDIQSDGNPDDQKRQAAQTWRVAHGIGPHKKEIAPDG